MLKRFICLLIVLSTCWTLLPMQVGATEELPLTVEDAIAIWKEDIRSRYADFPALQIEFSQDWRTVRDRYLRVDIHCTLSHDGLSQPLTTTRSFHATLSDGKLLDLEYFLISGGSDRLQEELASYVFVGIFWKGIVIFVLSDKAQHAQNARLDELAGEKPGEGVGGQADNPDDGLGRLGGGVGDHNAVFLGLIARPGVVKI